MTDRELLELAAIAIGGEYRDHALGHQYLAFPPHWNGSAWNPLNDDGDALRLAVMLDFCVEMNGQGPYVNDRFGKSLAAHQSCSEENHLQVVRRQIVRAAAEIGKSIDVLT
ncbi:hypothetical protein [Pseudomonas sp. TMB3-21]